MVEAGSEFVEWLTRARGVLDKTDFKSCAWLQQTGVALALVRWLVLSPDGEIEDVSIPVEASFKVGNRERWR